MTVIGDLTRRPAQVLVVAKELARASSAGPGVPSGPALAPVQRAGERCGGIPRLVAQALASYTGVAQPTIRRRDGTRLVRAAGRVARIPAARGEPAWSRPDPDPLLTLDRRLVAPILRTGMRLSPGRFEFAAALLRDMAVDATHNIDGGEVHRAAEAVAGHVDAIDAPVRLEVVGPAGAGEEGLGIRTLPRAGQDADPVELVAALLGRGGLVHGRLGAVWPAGHPTWQITHWEASRTVSSACRAFLLAVVGAATGSGALEDATRLGTTVGIPEVSLRTNLPRLVPLLLPLRGRWPDDLPSALAPAPAVRRATDPVGVLGGIADLLEAARRSEAVPGPSVR